MVPTCDCWVVSIVAVWRSDHLPVGVSWQRNSKASATATIRTPGTMNATRHAVCGVRPSLIRLSYTAGMTKYVMPPPALPRPAVRELAVPMMFLS